MRLFVWLKKDIILVGGFGVDKVEGKTWVAPCQMRQMCEYRKQSEEHAKVAKPRTDRNKKEFQDTEGCGKFFVRYCKRT